MIGKAEMNLEELCKGSKLHTSKQLGQRSFQLSAKIENDQASLLAFQPVAIEAIRNAHDGGYELIFKHQTSQLPGDLYDIVVIELDG
jgi:hypothetical protein